MWFLLSFIKMCQRPFLVQVHVHLLCLCIYLFQFMEKGCNWFGLREVLTYARFILQSLSWFLIMMVSTLREYYQERPSVNAQDNDVHINMHGVQMCGRRFKNILLYQPYTWPADSCKIPQIISSDSSASIHAEELMTSHEHSGSDFKSDLWDVVPLTELLKKSFGSNPSVFDVHGKTLKEKALLLRSLPRVRQSLQVAPRNPCYNNVLWFLPLILYLLNLSLPLPLIYLVIQNSSSYYPILRLRIL